MNGGGFLESCLILRDREDPRAYRGSTWSSDGDLACYCAAGDGGGHLRIV